MNALPREHQTTEDLNPLAGLRVGVSEVAEIALGTIGGSKSQIGGGRHLAMLSVESLELDLSDPAQRRLGDYELVELIGEGGMGVVYRARQHSLDRNVAIKLLAAGPWASQSFIERFRREAQHAARMQHPNIVTIYEVATVEDLHFFSMRLVQGGSLASVLKDQGKLPALRAAQLLRTIAEAVDYAHRLGVLHLDLKPANVLIDENGNPHVADFGLARRLEQGLAATNNEISGTPSYMAPEQATAGSQMITPATDIWGLGAILYELVTGKAPFLGASAHAILKLVVEGAVRSPRRFAPELPRDLEAIILKCMAREVAARYPTARALADDLGRFIEKRPVQARPLDDVQRAWRWARRQPYLAALGFLFTVSMLVGIVGVTSQWRRAETNAIRAEANATVSKERLWEGRREAALRKQLDGKGFEALPDLLSNIEEQEEIGKSTLSGIERREIGAILNQGVTLIDRMIVPDAPVLAAELSPDGSVLALGLGDQTVRWFDTKTLTERGRVDISDLPASGDEKGEIKPPRLLRFVDNGRLRVTLEWYSHWVNPAEDDTYLIDLEHARVVEPPATFAGLTNAIFSADGHYALLHNRQHEMQLWLVDPWQPISALIQETPGTHTWMIGRDARWLASLGHHMAELYLYDRHHLTTPRKFALPADVSVTAWAESSDGATLALGDSKGRAFLLDITTEKLRLLPGSPGYEVAWLAFSEDNAWVAITRTGGKTYAYDVASGQDLSSTIMYADFLPRQVAVSHRDHLAVVSGTNLPGPGETIAWRLPVEGMTALGATRLLSAPTRNAGQGTNSVGTSLQSGLLAEAAFSGEVRLWRLPPSPIVFARAPEQIPGMLYFDGKHLVDVEYTKLRVVSTAGVGLTPWIELPQPVGFAALVDSSRTLIATSGTELRVFDAATLSPRYPPLPLNNTPMHLVADAAGENVVLGFGADAPTGFEVRLQAYDLKTGQRREGEAVVKGPLRQLELSADGSRLLATGPEDGTTDVFDSRTLQRLGSYAHEYEAPVIWACFAGESESERGQVFIAKGSILGAKQGNESLIRWDPQAGVLGDSRALPGNLPVGVIAASGKPFVAGQTEDVLDPGTAGERIADRFVFDTPTSTLAVSHDGRLIAHALQVEVQMYDAVTAAPVGPLLPAGVNGNDIIAQLAFSDDDRELLGRTLRGYWLVWPIAADDRPLAEIREDAGLLVPHPGSGHVLQLPGAGERERLRGHDPGDLPTPEPRPQLPAAREVAGAPIPVRDPATSPLLLDLTDAYTLAPESTIRSQWHVVESMRGNPLGVIRLDGVDYDVRGVVELTWLRAAIRDSSPDSSPSRVSGIRVPPVPIAALHVLLLADQLTEQPDEVLYASVRLHYLDGSNATLPIRTQREVPGWSETDRPTPFAWAISDKHRLQGDQGQGMISSPRLPNPHPERLIATIDLEAAQDRFAQPVFFAVTAEPVSAAANPRSKTDNDNDQGAGP
jgi:serine/threonine protein kinase/WD40 repeat protein